MSWLHSKLFHDIKNLRTSQRPTKRASIFQAEKASAIYSVKADRYVGSSSKCKIMPRWEENVTLAARSRAGSGDNMHLKRDWSLVE